MHLAAAPQVQTPVYRSGVYLVPFRISISPARPMSTGDFVFVVDNREFAAADLVPDAAAAGRFMVYFQPPTELRDGQQRNVQIKVKLHGKWRDGGKPVPLTMPVPDTVTTQSPIFRAGVFLVPMGVVMFTDRSTNEPLVGLTADDFLVVCDKKDYRPEGVTHPPDRPNAYTVFFQPSDALRDGKSHDLRLKIRQGEKWKTLPAKWPAVLEKSVGEKRTWEPGTAGLP